MFLFDEIDASNPQAVVTANAALDNGILDGPDGMIERHPDFRFIAAANTFGNGATPDYIGRNPLDAATLSRYAFVAIDYDEELERKMVIEAHGKEYASWVHLVQNTRKVARDMELRHIISPRASRDGAALLKGGLSKDFVFNSTVIKGLPHDDAVKLNNKIKKSLKTDLETIESQPQQVDTKQVVGLMADMAESSASLLGARDLVANMAEAQELMESTSEMAEQLKKSRNIVNQVQAIKDMLEKCTADSKVINEAVEIVEGARELKEISGEFAETKAIIENLSGDSKKAKAFIDAVDALSERAQNTTGFKKMLLKIAVGNPKDENILG